MSEVLTLLNTKKDLQVPVVAANTDPAKKTLKLLTPTSTRKKASPQKTTVPSSASPAALNVSARSLAITPTSATSQASAQSSKSATKNAVSARSLVFTPTSATSQASEQSSKSATKKASTDTKDQTSKLVRFTFNTVMGWLADGPHSI